MNSNESSSRKFFGSSKPARYWLGTKSYSSVDDFGSRLNELTKSGVVQYAVGQREIGGESGYEHWQFVVNLKKPQRISWLKKEICGVTHWEPCRSESAESYVTKDETAVAGTRFEYGTKSFKRNCSADWDQIVEDAKRGRLDNIPSDVLVRCYSNLRRISSDYSKPVGIERRCYVFWGTTGTGKSRTAWELAGLDAYPKDPRTKFWDGYQGQANVVIDEFRGGIDISHMLRWLDRYPVLVEIKGSSTVLKASSIWITSNLDPRLWYPELDEETKSALIRRLEIKHFVL